MCEWTMEKEGDKSCLHKTTNGISETETEQVTDMTMKNATSYSQGDWIVHCHHGVGQIEDIERRRVSDQENTYFRVSTADSNLWIPVDQMDDNGKIRPVTDKECFQAAVDALNEPPRVMASGLSTRKSRIKQVVLDNMPVETARLIRDLRAKRRSSKGLNQSEWQALRGLTNRFVQEWAVCKGLTIEQARQRLNRKLDKRRATTKRRAETTIERLQST